MRADDPGFSAARRWRRIRTYLRWYVFYFSPTEWFPYFKKREGRWVVLRLFLLCGCTIGSAFGVGTGLAILGTCLAILTSLALAADILLFNTAVVFVTARPLSLLRSNIFTMMSYASLAVAFSPLWLLVPCFPSAMGNGWATAGRRSLDAFYQSVRTLTTSGTDIPNICRWGKLLASLEGLFGIYFLSIIIAGYLSLPKEGRSK